MKTIVKSILFTGVLALAVTGCQKVSDDTDVTLKAKIGEPTFECQTQGYDCGSAIKVEWPASIDVGYTSTYGDGNVITITSVDGDCFTWTSIYPVCAVLVKAGNGYATPTGAISGTGGTTCIPSDGPSISHVTFCYSPNPMIIAFKSQLSPSGTAYTVVEGMANLIDFYPFVTGNNGKIYLNGDISTPVGDITVGNFDDDELLEVKIEMFNPTSVYFFASSWLFVGTLDQFNACTSLSCYMEKNTFTPATSLIFDLSF